MGFGKSDILIEHQRGMMILGYPVFSPNLLIRGVDPPHFQLICEGGVFVEPEEIKAGAGMYPLDLNEAGKRFKWFVSMDHAGEYDTDDQGWCYGWRFRTSKWKPRNGFVRKRFWIRLPADTNVLSLDACGDVGGFSGSDESQEKKTTMLSEPKAVNTIEDHLLTRLKNALIDRQRLELVFDFLEKYVRSTASDPTADGRRELLDAETLDKILVTFQYQDSKERFLQRYNALLVSLQGMQGGS
ncbi:LAMI_0G12662g1_1 [Lachancea mirantina]|uniref:LAMI_0G12662g1_1 n=1 Tax=Lachancea mirantina TaxID=1230905 RepID=A0A1G4KBN8_9SACH|nr:LAMI_0G12662g1_1 [Lachancea mirantina]